MPLVDREGTDAVEAREGCEAFDVSDAIELREAPEAEEA